MITLKTLPQATEQEVFDQVAKHMLKQRAQSVASDKRTCAYRGAGGKKCAAGCLIADDEYSALFEGMTWTGLHQSGFVPDDHADIIIRLQRIHDVEDVVYWAASLANIAASNGLNPHVLSEASR